jgi:hypothetical protein
MNANYLCIVKEMTDKLVMVISQHVVNTPEMKINLNYIKDSVRTMQ